MASLRWTLKASQDLQSLEDLIANDSPLHAVRFVDLLLHAVEQLTTFPELGRKVPEFSQPNLRELIFQGYRVVYWLEEDVATILRVVHGTRDLKNWVDRAGWEF